MAKKRADGRLQRSFSVNGKRFFVYGHSKAELYEKEKLKREQLEKGIEKRENPTISVYFERWIDRRRGHVSEATIRTQTKIFETCAMIHIESASCNFGDIKIRKISVDDLTIVQRELLKTRKTSTTNDYLYLLKHILKDATNERIIDYNPALLIKPLRREEEKARDTVHRALTDEETTAFFQSDRCRQSYYYNVFRLAILSGLRVGEIGALQESDITEDTINVKRTITRDETGGYKIGTDAKTKAGRRNIPITEQIKTVLDEQKNINKLLHNNKIKSINRDDLLFRAPEGGLLMVFSVDREILRICKACGVESFSMHAFRDTFATRAIESGMNPKTLQEILGHKDFSTTMSLYAHVMESTKATEMQKLKIAI